MQVESKIQQQVERDGFPCDFVLMTDSQLPVDPRHNSKIDYAKTKAQFSRQLDSICDSNGNKNQMEQD